MKHHVITLQQVTHMPFDFTTPKGLEITPNSPIIQAPNDKNEKSREEREKENKRVKEKKKIFF